MEAATRSQQGAQQAFVGTEQEEQESGHLFTQLKRLAASSGFKYSRCLLLV